jgi:ribosomal protein S12 methylthiotransferase
MAELGEEIPQVDGYYGKFDWDKIVSDLKEDNAQVDTLDRVLTTPSHYAYVKISEGCDRTCAYCAIPIITGHHVSRPMEEIVDEVRYLVGKGVKEFQIIAQELTYYGKDLYHRPAIAELVERISDIPGVEWIRLHYAYPTNFPDDLLRVIRERDNVCKYLDIALQHVSTKILKKMLRPVTKEETYALVEKLRREVPGICLRTTMMVGFPGETDKDFEELMEFVRWARFDRLGAFAYSEEEGTYAALNYKDRISKKKKQERLDTLMAVQQRISTNLNYDKVGNTYKVIIDRIEGDYYIGRTEYDSPEVDTEVLIAVADGELSIGSFYNVEITDATEFDLMGRLSNL